MDGSLRIGIIGGGCPPTSLMPFSTTAAAIEGMRAAGFDASVANGRSVAFKKSINMGDAPDDR